MKRRELLGVAGSSLVVTLTGCAEETDDESEDLDGNPEETENESETEYDRTVRLEGMRVSGVDVTDSAAVEDVVARELGVSESDVSASEDGVELLVDGEISAFVSALEAAGLSVAESDVQEGVSADRLETAVSVLEDRFERAGIQSASIERREEEMSTIGIDLPDDVDTSVDRILERGEVCLVAGYPGDEGEYQTEDVLRIADIANIDSAQSSSNGQPARVPVQLNEQAAQRFAAKMQEAGFTSQGVGQCFFNPDEHDQPDQPRTDQYCLFTVVDGEYVYGARMGAGLADIINSGQFINDPRFLLTTSSFEKAEQLELYLKSGAVPAGLEVVDR